MKKLHAAIVGFGFMGRTHAKNILQSEFMELTALVDSQLNLDASGGNLDTGEWNAEALKGIRTYASLDDCLAKESLDLVYICVHTPAHYELGMQSLRHGLHVLMEKPFVLKPQEGDELIAEARKQNKYLGVAHVVRFMPAYVKLRELYQTREYGGLKFISLTRFSGVPAWGDWLKRRQDFGSSGGALFDLVVHDIDFLHYLLGLPDRVESKCFPGVLSKQDYVCAFWEYQDKDMVVKVEGGNTFPSQLPFEATFKAVFEQATLVYTSSNMLELQVINDESVETLTLDDPNVGYQNESEYFASCILNGKYPQACSAESSLDTIKLCYQHIGNQDNLGS